MNAILEVIFSPFLWAVPFSLLLGWAAYKDYKKHK